MEPSPELWDIITGWFEAASQGDTSWVDRQVSIQPGVRLVGTDPEEWFEAGDVVDFLKEEAQALGGNVEISIEPVEAHIWHFNESGKVIRFRHCADTYQPVMAYKG